MEWKKLYRTHARKKSFCIHQQNREKVFFLLLFWKTWPRSVSFRGELLYCDAIALFFMYIIEKKFCCGETIACSTMCENLIYIESAKNLNCILNSSSMCVVYIFQINFTSLELCCLIRANEQRKTIKKNTEMSRLSDIDIDLQSARYS